MKNPIISLTSDFGIQSQGVGIMEGMAFKISPETKLIHLMHGLPAFDITAASRTLETSQYLPKGCHVCVCDPGVGTERKSLIIETKRGDILIGPDNGVLMPASRVLGGIHKIINNTNEKYRNHPVSPIFHGRDVFVPAAAYICRGVPIDDFGDVIDASETTSAPYQEAVKNSKGIESTVIQINKFGSLHVNITHSFWDKTSFSIGDMVNIDINNRKYSIQHTKTFGDVHENEPVILKDDYGRVEIAINMGNFSKEHDVKIGDKVLIEL